jgi:hypothetical protein
VRLLLGLVLMLGACSEYELEAAPGDDDTTEPSTGDDDDTTPPGDDDTTEPPGDECPDPPLDAGTVDIDEECVASEVGTFTPVIEWHDPGPGDIYTTPLVANLNDDNADGHVDGDDMPDIVVATDEGSLWVLSGDGSGALWSNFNNISSVTPAIGDIDGDGWPDVVAVNSSGYLALRGEDGSVIWMANHGQSVGLVECGSIGIYDLDADGQPEIVSGSAILNGTDGSVRAVGAHGVGTAIESPVAAQSVAADIDQDGDLEVVVGNALYDANGATVWFNGEDDGYVAVGDFDGDSRGEIVVTSYGGEVRVQDDDGTVLWRTNLPVSRIGPPTVADFDADGEPEIGVAANDIYATLDTDGSILWTRPTVDGSSGCTGSSVFDFEGDGAAEVVYADENDVWVFDGATGAVKLQETHHSNWTCTEYPTVADVDNDGHAEIVYASYDYSESWAGVTVLGDQDDSWMPTRAIWNQHAYDITNVDDYGAIPVSPAANWLTYNSFRSSDMAAATGGAVSDALPELVETCPLECDDGYLRVVVWVGNGGTEALPMGVTSALYSVESNHWTLLETTTTSAAIAPGETSPGIVFELTPEQVPENRLAFVVDDLGYGSGQITECHEDNNTLMISDGLCN